MPYGPMFLTRPQLLEILQTQLNPDKCKIHTSKKVDTSWDLLDRSKYTLLTRPIRRLMSWLAVTAFTRMCEPRCSHTTPHLPSPPSVANLHTVPYAKQDDIVSKSPLSLRLEP